MAKPYKYTEEQFVEAVKSSISYREILNKLGLVEAGGNYFGLKARIKRMGLDTSHLLGQAHLKGKTHNWSKAKPLSDILIENSEHISFNSLKKRIIKAGLLENKCYGCGITEWLGKPIVCELEHINGIKSDCRLSNLTLLCPNCHSQTPTFRRNKASLEKPKDENGYAIKKQSKKECACVNLIDHRYKRCAKCYQEELRSKRKVTKINTTEKLYHFCECGKPIGKKSNRCYDCMHYSHRKAERPSKEELEQLIAQHGYSAIGRMFGVSDNAVRKWMKAYNKAA